MSEESREWSLDSRKELKEDNIVDKYVPTEDCQKTVVLRGLQQMYQYPNAPTHENVGSPCVVCFAVHDPKQCKLLAGMDEKTVDTVIGIIADRDAKFVSHGLKVHYAYEKPCETAAPGLEGEYETAAFSRDKRETKDLLLDNSLACQIPYLSQNGCMMPSVLTKVACQYCRDTGALTLPGLVGHRRTCFGYMRAAYCANGLEVSKAEAQARKFVNAEMNRNMINQRDNRASRKKRKKHKSQSKKPSSCPSGKKRKSQSKKPSSCPSGR